MVLNRHIVISRFSSVVKYLLLFHSAQFLVEMARKNAQYNVVEEEASVTAKQSHKPQQAVILVHVLSGKLETGVRYTNSEQELQGFTTL